MSGGSKQTTKSSQSTVSAPWSPAQPALNDILSRSASLSQNNDLFTPVQGATSQEALASLEGLAGQGSASLPGLQNIFNSSGQGFDAGLQTLMSTARGDNLQSNPYLQAYLDAAGNDVNQQFSGMGRYGSASHANELGGAFGKLRAQDYEQRRAEQLAASNQLLGAGFQGASLSPEIQSQQLFTPELLAQIGAARDAQTMGEKQAPINALNWQAGVTTPIAGLGGTSNSQGTQTTSTPGNKLGTAIGIGTTLAGLIPTGRASLGLLGGASAGSGLLDFLRSSRTVGPSGGV